MGREVALILTYGKNNLMEIWEGSLFRKVGIAIYQFLMNINRSLIK